MAELLAMPKVVVGRGLSRQSTRASARATARRGCPRQARAWRGGWTAVVL